MEIRRLTAEHLKFLCCWVLEKHEEDYLRPAANPEGRGLYVAYPRIALLGGTIMSVADAIVFLQESTSYFVNGSTGDVVEPLIGFILFMHRFFFKTVKRENAYNFISFQY